MRLLFWKFLNPNVGFQITHETYTAVYQLY